MARPLRIEYEGAFYHVTSRGNERGKIFFEKEDYKKFKYYLKGAHEKFGIVIHAYVLMGNHYHLLIETPEANLSRAMHYINGAYTAYINRKNKRSGHLFQGRYKAIIVDRDSYLLELSRYMHLNPVRVGMVDQPGLYPYSSYNCYLSSVKDEIVQKDFILGMLSKKKKEAKSRYRDFVENSEEIENPFREVYGGMVLGSIDFIKDILSRMKDDILAKGEISNRRELTSPSKKDWIIDCVANHYKIDKEEIFEGFRNPFKKITIYLLKRYTSASKDRKSTRLNSSHTDISRMPSSA